MGKHLKYDMGRRRTVDNNEEVKLNDKKKRKEKKRSRYTKDSRM